MLTITTQNLFLIMLNILGTSVLPITNLMEGHTLKFYNFNVEV